MKSDEILTCPVTGGKLVHTGQTNDGLVHYYQSENNPAYRYRRYRLDWTVLELPGENRHFHVCEGEMPEVERIGDKWMPLTASESERQAVLSDYRKRQLHLMTNMQAPVVKNLQARTLGMDLVPVSSLSSPTVDSVFEIDHTSDTEPKWTVTPAMRPSVDPKDCPLVEYITGLLLVVDQQNISEVILLHKEAQPGDRLYEWDMGGWHSLSGRAGDALFRDDRLISNRITRFS